MVQIRQYDSYSGDRFKDGQCVRLRQGDDSESTVFSDDPVQVAGKWRDLGAKRLHLVDLNGAFDGKPINSNAVNSIVKKNAKIYQFKSVVGLDPYQLLVYLNCRRRLFNYWHISCKRS